MLRFILPAIFCAQMACAEVLLDNMTTTEVETAIAAGQDTIIIPTGGTEQNGAHMVLGKHNIRVMALSERIAVELDDALVAPVIAYVPEGRIDPPEGHMRFPGTISVPEEVFALTVEYAARSLRQAGFRYIVLLGDSGGNQRALAYVAEKLRNEWPDTAVLYSDAYYRSNVEFVDWLRNNTSQTITGGHAALADTSLLMAISDNSVRSNLSEPHEGVDGDPTGATVELGQVGIEMFVRNTAAQIREFRAAEQ